MRYLLYLTIFLTLLACEQKNRENTSLFPAKEYGRYGFINVHGDFVIQTNFDEVHRFSEGFAAIRVDSLWGYIDSTGTIKIKPQFYDAEDFSNGLALVDLINLDLEQAFINTSGEIVFKPKEYTSSFREGFAKTKVNDLVAYYNVNGEIQIQTNFPYGDSFKEGIAKIWTRNSSKYIDKNGKTAFELDGMGHFSFSEGLTSVRIDGENVYVDTQGVVVIGSLEKKWACFDFSEGLAQVTIPGVNHKSGFIDRTGSLVIPIKYSTVMNFSEGLAAFIEENKWGFMNKSGEVVIQPIFDSIDSDGFNGRLCHVNKDGLCGYIDHHGKFIWTETAE